MCRDLHARGAGSPGTRGQEGTRHSSGESWELHPRCDLLKAYQQKRIEARLAV